MKKNFLVRVAFDGTFFKGTQKQPDTPTIQGLFEDLLTSFFHEETSIKCSSRLDSGVSARDFCFSFKKDTDLANEKIRFYLDSQSPASVKVNKVQTVPLDFDAKSTPHHKVYSYGLDLGKPDPITDYHLWNVGKIDLGILQQALNFFIGVHDFSSFSALNKRGERDQSFIGEITSIKIKTQRRKTQAFIYIDGHSFCRYQIRMMIGAGIRAAEGKLSLDMIKDSLEHPNIDARKYKAPAEALILEKTIYRKGGENA